MGSFDDTLSAIEHNPAFLTACTTQFRGIERESLRINEELLITQSAHPELLGSALTHPQVTTDFSEAQLEFITAVHPRIDTCLYDLQKLHQFTCKQLAPMNETLWAGSMPPALPDDRPIPVAQFGTSNVAQMKTTYRHGLVNRYNANMQTISGIHYNFSMSDKFFVHLQQLSGDALSHQTFKTKQYFNLIRNFHRYSPLFVYLFGASPAFDESFIPTNHQLREDVLTLNNTCYLPYATSLRMSDIGYTSEAQKSLYICFNNLENYTESLREAIKKTYPPYDALGSQYEDGQYKQLNNALLQIENEFYGTIRPKRVCASGEAPINALSRAGVEYVEVRCVDIDPFKPMGLDSETLIFLDMLLLYCLLEDSPEFSELSCRQAQDNLAAVIKEGRNPSLDIFDPSATDKKVRFNDWCIELLGKLEKIAKLMDTLQAESPYTETLKQQLEKCQKPETTPSARVIEALKEYGDHSSFMRHQNALWQQYFLDKPFSEESLSAFKTIAANSLAQQQAIEQADNQSFEAYLANYYEQY